MDRRELLKTIAVITGSVVIGGELFLSGCKTKEPFVDTNPINTNTSTGLTKILTAAQVALLNEIADTIIPTTADSPGAKAAKVGEFMNVMVTDCYLPANQKIFIDGLASFETKCMAKYKKNFEGLTPTERHDFIISMEKEAKPYDQKIAEDDKIVESSIKKANDITTWAQRKEFVPTGRHPYTMMKQLTLLGYFTSEIGMTKARRHVPVPGKYDGALAYNAGDKAWAE